MISRRHLLLGASAATLGSALSASALTELLEPGAIVAPGTAAEEQSRTSTDDAIDARLRSDLSQMDTRANSEEGVPVFLACLNLVEERGTHKPRQALTPFNAKVATQFRESTAAWERIRPKSTASDVGLLIEVLAARDFTSGGKEYK